MVQSRKTYHLGELVKTVTIEIPQVRQTYAFTTSGTSKAFGVSYGTISLLVDFRGNFSKCKEPLTQQFGKFAEKTAKWMIVNRF